MITVAILAHVGIALGSGVVMLFFIPAISRAARVGYGLDLRWTTAFALVFFLACGLGHTILAVQLIYFSGHTVHFALATGVALALAVIEACAVFGEFISALCEIVMPFSHGWTRDRDEELAALTRTIVRASREPRTEPTIL